MPRKLAWLPPRLAPAGKDFFGVTANKTHTSRGHEVGAT